MADLKPQAGLAPANGSWERVRLQEMLNFITSEIHAGLSPLFNAEIPESVKTIFKEKLFRRFARIEHELTQHDYLSGADFSIADAYLFTVMQWNAFFDIDLDRWPAIAAYMERIAARPAVRAALAAEATMA